MMYDTTRYVTTAAGLLLAASLLSACGGSSSTTTGGNASDGSSNADGGTAQADTATDLAGRVFIENQSGNLLLLNAGGTATGYTGTGDDAATETLTWNLDGSALSVVSEGETAVLTLAADGLSLGSAADAAASLTQALPLSVSAMQGAHFKLDEPLGEGCLAGGTLSVDGSTFTLREQCNTMLGMALVTQSSTLEDVSEYTNVVRRYAVTDGQGQTLMVLKSGSLDNRGVFVNAAFTTGGFGGIQEVGFERVAEPLQE